MKKKSKVEPVPHPYSIEQLEAWLAECFKITGADCDGNEDWRLASNAVAEVRALRDDYDNHLDECDSRIMELEGRISDLETNQAA